MNMLESLKDKINPGIISIVVIWIITILVAGFIAQFGKRLADYLTDKIKTARTKRGEGAADPSSQDKSHETLPPRQTAIEQSPTASEEKTRLKREKKLAKASAKQEKKKS
jgi:hypothetical protein